MRGKLDCCTGSRGAYRLIPAHAGKTTTSRKESFQLTAHPRACGENASDATDKFQNTGSSPRMRGKRSCSSRTENVCGLIPAHAGKTSRRENHRITPAAHPRACGENPALGNTITEDAGSSPRMRGKPTRGMMPSMVTGLIPAHAGKTRARTDLPLAPWAHPRACGENRNWSRIISRKSGSSPRMRGKPRETLLHVCGQGLIPAHAGKTSSQRSALQEPTAHPRACGENVLERMDSLEQAGSSPRMRGKPVRSALRCRSQRLIPAHAGKTSLNAWTLWNKRAHPRACGENHMQLTDVADRLGSSPRMRGKLDFLRKNPGSARLIPAHAGKTYSRPPGRS